MIIHSSYALSRFKLKHNAWMMVCEEEEEKRIPEMFYSTHTFVFLCTEARKSIRNCCYLECEHYGTHTKKFGNINLIFFRLIPHTNLSLFTNGYLLNGQISRYFFRCLSHIYSTLCVVFTFIREIQLSFFPYCFCYIPCSFTHTYIDKLMCNRIHMSCLEFQKCTQNSIFIVNFTIN
jgi:hypothetical protein